MNTPLPDDTLAFSSSAMACGPAPTMPPAGLLPAPDSSISLGAFTTLQVQGITPCV